MDKIDLIIDALERANELWLTEPMGEKALAAAHELKALAKPEQESEAYGYAKRLAEFIWEKHFQKESPNWKPLENTLGVLTQIDNMTCVLEKAKPDMPTKIFAPNLEQILNAARFYRREWVGLNAKDLSEIPSSCFEGAIWADGKLRNKNT